MGDACDLAERAKQPGPAGIGGKSIGGGTIVYGNMALAEAKVGN